MKFEDYIQKLEHIIEELESGDVSLDDSIEKYKEALSLIAKASEVLNEAEGKIKRVTEKNGKIKIETLED